MSKVLTVRIDNELYKYLRSQSIPLRQLVTSALYEYLSKLNDKTETKVYAPYTGVNKEIFENKYQALTRLIDKHLNALKKVESPICCICNDPIESEPYRAFGDLYYCSRKCWLNGDTK